MLREILRGLLFGLNLKQEDSRWLGHVCGNNKVIPASGVSRGGFRVFKPPPPQNSEGPPKNRAKLNPIVKTVKQIVEFRTPTHQDVRKKNAVKF